MVLKMKIRKASKSLTQTITAFDWLERFYWQIQLERYALYFDSSLWSQRVENQQIQQL